MRLAPHLSFSVEIEIPFLRRFHVLIHIWLIVGFISFVTVHLVRGQDADLAEQRQVLLTIFQAKQSALMQDWQSLVTSGATDAQIEAWQQQNAPLIAAQQQRAQLLSLLSSWDQLPVPGRAVVPDGASPTLAALLQAGATLRLASVQMHNQWAQTLPVDATADEIMARQQQEAALFQQQNATTLATQSQQAQTLATESAGAVLPMPPPLQIPPTATPQLAAYLVASDQLMRAGLALQNQYAAANFAVRQAAFEQWQQANANLFAQLQRLAQALSSNP